MVDGGKQEGDFFIRGAIVDTQGEIGGAVSTDCLRRAVVSERKKSNLGLDFCDSLFKWC